MVVCCVTQQSNFKEANNWEVKAFYLSTKGSNADRPNERCVPYVFDGSSLREKNWSSSS